MTERSDGSGLPMPCSSVVHFGPTDLPPADRCPAFVHSMRAAFSASCLHLPATPPLRAWATPHGFSDQECQQKPAPGSNVVHNTLAEAIASLDVKAEIWDGDPFLRWQ